MLNQSMSWSYDTHGRVTDKGHNGGIHKQSPWVRKLSPTGRYDLLSPRPERTMPTDTTNHRVNYDCGQWHRALERRRSYDPLGPPNGVDGGNNTSTVSACSTKMALPFRSYAATNQWITPSIARPGSRIKQSRLFLPTNWTFGIYDFSIEWNTEEELQKSRLYYEANSNPLDDHGDDGLQPEGRITALTKPELHFRRNRSNVRFTNAAGTQRSFNRRDRLSYKSAWRMSSAKATAGTTNYGL